MNHLLSLKLLSLPTALLMLWQAAALAEPVPPPFNMSDTMPEPFVHQPPVSGINLGRLKLQFERIPLSELRALASAGEIAHRGDAAESTYWLCYTISGPTAQRIWFIAGELDGPDHFVSGIQAITLAAGTAPSEGCPPLPNWLQPITLSSHVWLGTAKTASLKALGKPSASGLNAVTYTYVGKVLGSYQGEKVSFDRASFVHLVFQGGQVRGIVASQTTTD